DELEAEFSFMDTYCLNSAAPILHAVSDNGITGTWNPAVIDTSMPGTFPYTFTPDAGQCAAPFQIDIEITDQILPQFTLPATYCVNETPAVLPSVSDNGIPGTWSPAVIDTGTAGTTVYTFTPDAGSCSIEIELEIEVTQGVL